MNEYRGQFNRPDKNGEYTYQNIQGDIDCYINVPNNATSNTSTIIHEHGSTVDWVWYNSQKEALARDAKCVFPASNTREMINTLETTYREVLNQKGDTENLILTGHSAGGPASLKALATMYKEGKITGEPPLVVMLDGSFVSCALTPEEVQILADNKVPIIAYYQLENQTANYKKLGEAGVNIAMIRDYEDRTHAKPCTNFFENKNGLFDFVTGNGTLMTGNTGYGVSVWTDGVEKYTNGVNLKDLYGVNTLDKIYMMMGIYSFEMKINHLKELNKNKTANLSLSTNINLFDTGLDQIISNIGNTSYISSNINCQTENSSSSSISKIADLTINYFQTTTDLLFSISKELQEFKKISPAFEYMENQIENDSLDLNNLINIENIEFKEYKTPFESE